jgi:SAM-dependent methyltransferase
MSINSLYAQTIFNFIYGKIDGYRAASISQSALPGSHEELLYGEIPFETWQKIIQRAQPNLDGVFYDLGSGIGRVALQSHLIYNFKKSVGIELLKGLHGKAVEAENIFNKFIRPQIAKNLDGKELKFICGDILQEDFCDADLILLSHPFKDEEQFLILEEKFLKTLKPKTKIVTLIRFLRDERFKSLGFGTFNFSWGKSSAYFYEI